MNKWDSLLKKRHAKYYDNRKHGTLVWNNGMPKSAISKFKKESGYTWCDEFFDLYSEHDGVGIEQPDKTILWYLLPIAEIAPFRKNICGTFQETHPQVASVFFPFYDWANGDAIGYIKAKEVEGFLFEFQHEEYIFDPEQEVSDFIKPIAESISDFLKA